MHFSVLSSVLWAHCCFLRSASPSWQVYFPFPWGASWAPTGPHSVSITTVISGTVNGESETLLPMVPSARPDSRPLWSTSGRLGLQSLCLWLCTAVIFLECRRNCFTSRVDVSKMEFEVTSIAQMAPELWAVPAHSGGFSRIRLRPESPGTQDLPGALLVLIFYGLWGF